MNWEAVGVTIQAVEATAVIVTLLYAWQQIKIIRQEISLGAIWNIFAELSSEQAQSSRKYVYEHRLAYTSELGKLEELPYEARLHAERVSNTLDRVGYLVNQKLIPESVVLDGYHNIVARSWIVLEPYIQNVRQSRGEYTYQRYFEALAERAFQKYTTREKAGRTLDGKG